MLENKTGNIILLDNIVELDAVAVPAHCLENFDLPLDLLRGD